VAKPRIIREANIIGRSPTSFAEGKHHSKNAPLSVDKSAFFVDGTGGSRTLSHFPSEKAPEVPRFLSLGVKCCAVLLRKPSRRDSVRGTSIA